MYITRARDMVKHGEYDTVGRRRAFVPHRAAPRANTTNRSSSSYGCNAPLTFPETRIDMIMEQWSALSSGSLSVALFMTVWSKMMERTSAASAYPSVKYSGSRCCEKHM